MRDVVASVSVVLTWEAVTQLVVTDSLGTASQVIGEDVRVNRDERCCADI